MVKVIENNNIHRCRCEHCDSVLEYTSADKTFVEISQRQGEYKVFCPACNRYTRFDIPETYDTTYLNLKM